MLFNHVYWKLTKENQWNRSKLKILQFLSFYNHFFVKFAQFYENLAARVLSKTITELAKQQKNKELKIDKNWK